MTLRQSVPALITMVALGSGMAALEAARLNEWDIALRLVLLAAVADGIDGPLARRLRAAGPMGKQLDSLADIIAFGVAPAFLFASHYTDAPDIARFAIAFVFVGAGALRLARFHSDPGDDVFFGLPITAAGVLLAVTVAGPFTLEVQWAGAMAVVLAVLMVSRHPFPKLAQWRGRLLPGFAAAMPPIVLWPNVETLAILAAIFLGLYVLWAIVRRFRSGIGQEVDREVLEMTDAPRHSARRPARRAFLRGFFRDRQTIGAVAPSSRGVARRIASLADVKSTRMVAEFGPGTGSITHELLAALPEDAQLWAFEVYPPFVRHLCETIDDPRLKVLDKNAAEIANVREQERGFDAIVSSIPFSLIGPEKTMEILRATAQTLRNDGVFVALQYHPRYLAPLLRAEFAHVKREVYPWNIPPATLLRASGPRRAK